MLPVIARGSRRRVREELRAAQRTARRQRTHSRGGHLTPRYERLSPTGTGNGASRRRSAPGRARPIARAARRSRDPSRSSRGRSANGFATPSSSRRYASSSTTGRRTAVEVRAVDEPVAPPGRTPHRVDPLGVDVELGRRVGVDAPPARRAAARAIAPPGRGPRPRGGHAGPRRATRRRRSRAAGSARAPPSCGAPSGSTGRSRRARAARNRRPRTASAWSSSSCVRHQQAEGASPDPLVEVELHPIAHERHRVGELVVAAGQGVALHPPFRLEQLRWPRSGRPDRSAGRCR